MVETLELTTNRELIDPDFDGYKLSLDSIPCYEANLDNGVFIAQRGENQFSYAHARIYSLHNHLLANPYAPGLVYFVDKDWNISQISFGALNRVQSIVKVCVIPKNRDSQPGDLPVTVEFASADRAVIFDGTGTFHVALVKKDKWVIIFSDCLPDKSILLSVKQDGDKLAVLTQSIVEPSCVSVLDFFVLDGNWLTAGKQKVELAGNLVHASIPTSDTVIVVINGSQKHPKFVRDGVKIGEKEPEPKYAWTQTAEDFAIVVKGKDNLTVDLNGQSVEVTVNGETVINGEFAYAVRDVTWTKSADGLEIRGMKVESGIGWQEIIRGDSNGRQYQAEIVDEEETGFNAEELEEVDAADPSALFRLRMDGWMEKIDLSTQPLLFAMRQDDAAVGLCIRNLTDGCLWSLNAWPPRHIATFSAFGYVQASKTLKKFVTAPTDFNYVVVADSTRHIYIFRQPSAVAGDLRNRVNGTRVKSVARQQIFNLGDADEILGVFATPSCLFLITCRKFYVLAINA